MTGSTEQPTNPPLPVPISLAAPDSVTDLALGYRQILDGIPLPAALVDLSGMEVLACNPSLRKMYAVDSQLRSTLLRLADNPLLKPWINATGNRALVRTRAELDIHQEKIVYECCWNQIAEPLVCLLTLSQYQPAGAQGAEFYYEANVDPLTNLPNRRAFDRELEKQLQLATAQQAPLSLMFLDLDGFKEINDSLGHEAGDELLIEVAQRLQKTLRKGDLIARLGGDEFAVININCDRYNAAETAERIIQAIRQPVRACGFPVTCSVSIGLAAFPDDGKSGQELLKHADVAMYQAKRNKSGFSCFRSEDYDRIRERFELRRELELLIANDSSKLELHYQPRVDLRNGSIITVEALARWNDPRRGYISPDVFIPIAQETTLIHKLGKLMLRRVCQQLLRWRSRNFNLRVAFNLADKEFEREDIVEQIAAILSNYDLPADLLEIEITENAAMRDIDRSVELLAHLKSLGVHVAVDDFGTGFTSLTCMKKLPADLIKIDKSFLLPLVDREAMDSPDADIVRAIVTLADSFHMGTVAEGVETESQFSFLRSLGCDFAQGYFFNMPMPPDDIERLLFAR